MNLRRKSAFLAMLFGYAGVAVSLTRNILLVPVYLTHLPLAVYGAWLATGGALALILISDYGLSGVVTQRISMRYGAGDGASLGSLSGSAIIISSLLALALSALSLCLVPFLPSIRSLDAAQTRDILNCFLIAVAANALGVVGATATSVLRSVQRAGTAGFVNLVGELANVAVILVGLMRGEGVYALAFGLLARALIITSGSLCACWLVCTRHLKVQMKMQWATVRELGGEASRFFLSSVSLKLLAQANVFFIGWLLGPKPAASFSLTVRAHETVVMVIVLISGSLVPSITHLYGSGDLARFRVVIMRLLLLLAALTAFIMTLTVVLNADFVRLWVGESAFAGQSVSLLMAAAFFVSLTGGVAYDAMLAQGKFKEVTRAYVASGLMQLALLSCALRFGEWVAPLTTLVAASIWSCAFWRSFAISTQVAGTEVRAVVQEILKLLAASASAVVLFRAIYPRADGWGGLVVEGVLCSSYLLMGYLLVGARLRQIAQEEIGTTFRLFKPT